jgi:hypothetical protein
MTNQRNWRARVGGWIARGAVLAMLTGALVTLLRAESQRNGAAPSTARPPTGSASDLAGEQIRR